MTDATDSELMQGFADHQSEAAFAQLVQRHINLVYSVALRFTGHAEDARDVTQAVFIILAQKAASLRQRTTLTGWLYETTRLTARQSLRTRARQFARDQEAYMQSHLNEPDTDGVWQQLAPQLEEAMSRLNENERALLALRFFENKTGEETAFLMGIRADAAHKRTARAVEKLRGFFTKRGVTLSATVLTAAISANSVQAAPLGLAATVTAAAAKGTLISATITTLVNTTMKTMTWLKIKFAAGVGIATLIAGGVATVAVSQNSDDDKWTPQGIAKQSQDAYAALSSYSDNGTAISDIGGENSKTTFATRLARPNLYRIGWTQANRISTENGILWSGGSDNFMAQGSEGKEKTITPQKMNDAKQAFGICAAVSGQGSCAVAETFFDKKWCDSLMIAASEKFQIKKKTDEQAGGVDCHVFSYMIDPTKFSSQGKLPNNMGKIGISTTTLWIGKHDHFIHQIRTSMEGMSLAMPRQSDDNIKAILERQNKPATPEAIAAWRAQMGAMMKQAQGTKYVSTQTHENIVVNQKFSPTDFAR